MNREITRKIRILAVSAVALLAAVAVISPTALMSDDNKIKKTSDWYKDEESRMIFFTVLEGLYRDGVPDRAVDLIIGNVKKNTIDKNFVFRCKLCHATYEAFCVYQRRPIFSGTEGVKSFGQATYTEDFYARLSGDPMSSSRAMGEIVQPWVRAKMKNLAPDDKERKRLLEKFVKLANEGNALINSYTTCQACDAIAAVAEEQAKKKSKSK